MTKIHRTFNNAYFGSGKYYDWFYRSTKKLNPFGILNVSQGSLDEHDPMAHILLGLHHPDPGFRNVYTGNTIVFANNMAYDFAHNNADDITYTFDTNFKTIIYRDIELNPLDPSHCQRYDNYTLPLLTDSSYNIKNQIRPNSNVNPYALVDVQTVKKMIQEYVANSYTPPSPYRSNGGKNADISNTYDNGYTLNQFDN